VKSRKRKEKRRAEKGEEIAERWEKAEIFGGSSSRKRKEERREKKERKRRKKQQKNEKKKQKF
jgi:hypothetical protein